MTEQHKQESMKYRLADSMKECMKVTPVDRITVSCIVEGCHTTRQTFYRNFKDKYDLINWYFDKMVQESLNRIEDAGLLQQSLEQKFEFIQNEKVFFSGAFRSDDHNSLKEHDYELFLKFYRNVLERKLGHSLNEEQEMQLKLYCRGAMYMTVEWVLGGMKTSVKEMSRTIADAIPSHLAKILL